MTRIEPSVPSPRIAAAVPEDPRAGSDRRRRHAWCAVLLIAAIGGLFPFLRKEPSELPVYVTGAERMLGGEAIYRTDDDKPFTYPPAFALPFVPFAVLPDVARRPLWYALNLGLLAWVLLRLDVLARHLAAAAGARPRTVLGVPRAALWTVVALLAARHVLAVFQNQSHDLFIGLAVVEVAVAWSAGRELRAGLWAGIGTAFKATPLLFLVPFALQLRLGAVAGLSAAAVALTLLPDLLFPADDGRLWIAAWTETFLGGLRAGETAASSGIWHAESFLNQSLSGTVHRLTTPTELVQPFVRNVAVADLDSGARRLVTVGAQALVAGIVAVVAVQRCGWWPVGRARATDPPPGDGEIAMRRLADVAAVACGMVLLSPMSSKSHFNVLIVPAAFVAADLLWRRRDLVLAVLLVGVFAIGTSTTKGVWGRELGNVLLSYGAVTWGALLLLAAVAHAAWLPRRRSRPLDDACGAVGQPT